MTTRNEAAAKAIGRTYGKDWDTDATAAKVLKAADRVMFAPASIAEIVRSTGLSIQTVTEVVRALKGAGQ